MKIFAFAAALMVSSAALAQATPPADPAAPAPMEQPSDMTSPPGTDASAQSPAPAPVADPAAAAPAPTGAVAQATYPRCSATVTDQCRQSSARESDYKGGPAKQRRKRG